MSDYTEFFLSSARSVVNLELLEISHPSFSKVYRIVRNHRAGITVTLETSEVAFFEWVPLKITNSGARDDLDTGLEVSFGDLGQILPKELDGVDRENTYKINPIVIYRTYRSDDLTSPLIGPFRFEIKALSQNQIGATFQANAPGLNYSKTGEVYRIDRFPMLRGFL